jgi:16S rRNA processing protein RimM
VGKAHGLSGDVYVMPISDDPHRFDPGSHLLHGSGAELVIETSRSHHQRLIVHFEGIETREEAEGLRGALYVTPDDLRELDDSEFWEHDLVGCAIVDQSGEELGRIEAIIPGAAQDLLEVATSRGPCYVPLVTALVLAVDLESHQVTVDVPPGLLD